jgi:hypothetical protein
MIENSIFLFFCYFASIAKKQIDSVLFFVFLFKQYIINKDNNFIIYTVYSCILCTEFISLILIIFLQRLLISSVS